MKLKQFWDDVRSSLWFVPSLLVILSVVLAFVMVAIDRAVGTQVAVSFPLLFDAGPEGARSLLSVVAGSLLSVAGVAFSFAVVVFSFASSQYSPRTLRNFMDDRVNQIVLGTLLGSFVYCLLVLRTVRLENSALSQSYFIPALSITVALLLALISLSLFIIFLHHIAESIQAYRIINKIGASSTEEVKRAFPKKDETEPDPKELITTPSGDTALVVSPKTGYIQSIDEDRLADIAAEHDLVIKIAHSAGHFMIQGKILATVTPVERMNKDIKNNICGAFSVGARRNPGQDTLYGLLQLSDVAAKALSPGINDPTTALMCMDQMGHLLVHAARREDPEKVKIDDKGTVRVILAPVSFRDMVEQAFNHVRRYGITDAAIPQRMLELIVEVAEETEAESRLGILKEHALAVIEDCDRQVKSSFDRAQINDTIRKLSREPVILHWHLPLLKPELEDA